VGGDETVESLSEAAKDAKWDLLENYIFFVVIPFLTDFYSADHPLIDANPSVQPRSASMQGIDAVASSAFGFSKEPENQVDLAPDALLLVSRKIAKTARKMTNVEYVMGKEMLRQSLDNLLHALLKKTVTVTSIKFDGTVSAKETQNLVIEPERKYLNKAISEIDDWNEDEDVLDLGGDLDEETVIAKVKQAFVTSKAFTPFMSALEQCMWQRDHQELMRRKLQKTRHYELTGIRNWELLIQPPIPASPVKVNSVGKPVIHAWCDKSSGDSGLVVDTSLLGEWSTEFNQLVDLYQEHLQSYCDWKFVSDETLQENDEDEMTDFSATPRKQAMDAVHGIQMTSAKHAFGMGREESSRGNRGKSEVMIAFLEWSGHGEAYFTELLEHLRRSTEQRFA